MYKAAYSFKHENPKIIPFKTGSLFVVLKENDNSWWLCLAQNGRIGLVPSNYIEPYQPESSEFSDFIEQSLSLVPKHKHYFSVDYLPLAASVLDQLKLKFNGRSISQSSSSTQYPPSSSASSSSIPPTPQTLPPPPLTPSTPMQQPHNQHLQLDQPHKPSQNNSNNIDIKSSQLSEKETKFPNNFFWSLVTKIRESTDINFERSRGVLKMVLAQLSLVRPSWDDAISSLLDQENIDIAAAISFNNNEIKNGDDDVTDGVLDIQLSLQNILLTSRDSNDLTQILEHVGQVVEDGQQSSWCLFEDLEANTKLLKQLLAILTNANESLCSSILSREQFLACHHLVQYYQMETRAPLRKLLIQVFSRICKLGDRFTSELLSMVLPLELARQLMSAVTYAMVDDDVTGLLCTLFSTAEAIPQQHYTCFNLPFLTHLLNLIESVDDTTTAADDDAAATGGGGGGVVSNETDTCTGRRERLIEVFMNFNQHLQAVPAADDDNACMHALRERPSHKHLTEYLLLLFNRGDASKYGQASMKLLIDIFSSTSTAHIFYTNDANVLVDIIYRQINDLSPGDPERSKYLQLLHLFLLHSDYWQHPHRAADIQASIRQIRQEDPPSERDKAFVDGIMTMFEK